MSLNDETSWILRAGTTVGLVLLTIGLLTSTLDIGNTILYAGTLVLICTPMAGVLVSTKCLLVEKDRFWSKIALLLILVVAAGLAITVLT
ncbi:MAG: DUF1634 domain-containing protein [archaeon]|nr:DUF1634 domain-containing protein [archaeon]